MRKENFMEDIIAAMNTSFSGIAADATLAIASGVAAAIPIMGLLLAARIGIKAFRSVSK